VVVSVIAAGSFIAAGVMARPYVHGLSFVIRAADLHGVMRLAAYLDAESVRERDLTIPLPTGSIRARAYESAGKIRRTARQRSSHAEKSLREEERWQRF